MQFKTGDKVKFLNDVGEGTVIRKIDNNLYEVENNDGFNVPVLKSELILIDDNNNYTANNNSGKIKIDENKPENKIDLDFNDNYKVSYSDNNDSNDINLFLALVPENENDILNSNLEAFFINDSDFYSIVVVKTLREKKYHLLKTINIEPDTKIKIFDIKRDKLNDYSKLFVQVILYKQITKFNHKTFDKKIVLKANKLYSLNSFKENDYTDEPAVLFSIDKADEPEKIIKNNSTKLLNQKINSDLRNAGFQPQQKKEKKSDTVEIDLHIGELLDDYSGLSNFEILSIQIAEFKKQMESAILDKHIRKIVFIHGVGEGTLKFELRKTLDKEYSRYEYQDASFENYGFGATMVLLR